MPECVVTTAFLKTYIAAKLNDVTAMSEAYVDLAKELLDQAELAGGARRLTQLRAFYLLEAVLTRPKPLLDPMSSITWPRSRAGLTSVLAMVKDRHNDATAVDAEDVIGGTTRTAGLMRQSIHTNLFRQLELVEGCATFLRRTLNNTQSWRKLNFVGSWGAQAFMLYTTDQEVTQLAQQMLAITEEDNQRAWHLQTQ